MRETILVLGGDGYYGWPIALKLAVSRPNTKIIIADNEWRRNTVKKIGSDSLVPISRLEERVKAFREVYGQNNLHYVYMDVNSSLLEDIIKVEKPHTIYHMAQQCSAPYSMLGLEESLYTINNNEGNNMRLLWAVRKHLPDCHIVKMGSMGEYCNGGIDIAEGYFYPEFNGKTAAKPMPFPRQSDDVYHISKINDSNYVGMAARKWGLRITEVMQSTLFGIYIDEMLDCDKLYTRFDYDDIFGTVVNRFITQAVAGHPLTIYGKGNQTTGIMPMKDAVNSLEIIAGEIPERGEHKVVNHVTAANNSINELASYVKDLAEPLGFNVTVNHVFDPRGESEAKKYDIKVMAQHVENNVAVTAIQDIISETLQIVAKHQHRIKVEAFTHHINAFQGKYNEEAAETPVLMIVPAENINVEAEAVTPSASFFSTSTGNDWEAFRKTFFHTDRLNLNPGTLGTVSTTVKDVRWNSSTTAKLSGNPIGLYEEGRAKLAEVVNVCNEIWPSNGYEISIGNGTSQTINLLALSMLRVFYKEGNGPIRVMTTHHEHPGGIGVFENLPEYDVFYVSDEVIENEDRLAAWVQQIKPHVAFISQVYYADGNTAAYETWNRVIKRQAPECKLILDVTQAIGLYNLPFGTADVLIGSLHKWVFGPHGSGIVWMKQNFQQWLGGMYWNGVGVAGEERRKRFSLQGGQDFIMYAEILEALKLYKEVGTETVLQRSAELSSFFREKLEQVLNRFELQYKILNKTNAAPLLSIAFTHFHPYELYRELNENGVHCKCIIDYDYNGEKLNILRFGLPYYETENRLQLAITSFQLALQKLTKVIPMILTPVVEQKETNINNNETTSATDISAAA